MREKEIIDNPICEHCGDECCVGYNDVIYINQTEEYYCSTECFFELQGVELIWVKKLINKR